MDQILLYPYPHLFCLTNTDIDMDISLIQKLISIFICNGYRYKLKIKSMDINIDISQIIKFYNQYNERYNYMDDKSS